MDEKKVYNVIYTDLSYQSYEMTQDEFNRLSGCLESGKSAFRTKEFILLLKDVRTVVEYKEPEVTDQELDGLTPEQKEWIIYQRQLDEELQRERG